jgi:hypothetical protein
LQEAFVFRRKPALRACLQDQVGTTLGGQAQGLFTAPAGDVGVMAGQQLRRHSVAFVDFGAGVVGAVEQAGQGGIERVLHRRFIVVENAGQQAHRGIDDGHGGQLTA